jgi:outer membrane receptor for ferrienterochelin and colicin
MKKPSAARMLAASLFASGLSTPSLATSNLGMEEVLFGEIPVVFVASKAEEKPDLAPAVVSVITADQIERSGATTISEVLQRVPGFFPTRQFFHDDVLGARGFQYHTNDHVVLLLDGHNISRSGWTNFQTGDIDELMSLDKVARVEVIHGPGSLVWGENAMIAVINVVTKKPKDVDGTQVTYRYGKFADSGGGVSRIASVLYGKEWDDETSLMWQVNVPTVDGWVAKNYAAWFRETVFPQARVDNFNNMYQSYEFWAKAKLHEWDMWFRAMNAHQNVAIFQYPGGAGLWEDQLDFSPQVYSMVLKRQYKPFQDATLDTELAFDKYHFDGRGFGFGGTSLAQPDMAFTEMTQTSNAADLNANLSYKRFEKHDILAGAQYVHMQFGTAQIVPRNLDDINKLLVVSSTDVTVDIWQPTNDETMMVYLQDTWKAHDTLNLIYGGRGEWNKPRGFDKGVFNPRGGLVYHTPGDVFVLKYLYNTGYRRPTQWQSQWGPGLFGIEQSLADNPEYSYNHDLQAVLTTGKTRTSLTFWHQKIKGVIDALPTPGNPSTKSWANAGNFYSDGLEFEETVRLSQDSLLGLNAAWTRTAVQKNYVTANDLITGARADNRYLDSPELTATLFADIALTPKYSVNAAWRYITEHPGRLQTDDNGNLVTTIASPADGQDVIVRNVSYLDLTFSGRKLWNNKISWSLRGLNILNNRKRIPQSQGDHDLYVSPPAFVEGSLAYHF